MAERSLFRVNINTYSNNFTPTNKGLMAAPFDTRGAYLVFQGRQHLEYFIGCGPADHRVVFSDFPVTEY